MPRYSGLPAAYADRSDAAFAQPGQWTPHVTLARRVPADNWHRRCVKSVGPRLAAAAVGSAALGRQRQARVSGSKSIAGPNAFRHAHPPRVDHQLAEFLEVDRVEPDLNPVVSHLRLARQHELVGFCGHHRRAFLLGEADAHHRLVPRERGEDDAPDAEPDLVAHHRLIRPRQDEAMRRTSSTVITPPTLVATHRHHVEIDVLQTSTRKSPCETLMPSTSRRRPNANRAFGSSVSTDCHSGSSAPAASHCSRDCSSTVKPST